MTNSGVSLDPRKADAAYRSFPPFSEWAKCKIDTERWEKVAASLARWGEVSAATVRRAREIIKLATAIDTGAIEGLYEVNRGFTFSVAVQTEMWRAAIEKEKGPKVRALIESQLHAYDFVLDFATQWVPIAEAWIRQLHAEITESQETYPAHTEIGIQELPLPRGQYKTLPNHVRRGDGTTHSHAPVDLTPSEMHRLCEELRSEAFLAAHPILQASYAHYVLVVIHPFADGNGRVARALASVYTYRSNSIPLLILSENRGEYLAVLEEADRGDFQKFVAFIFERGADTVRLTEESFRAAELPSAEESLARIRMNYKTQSGYTYADIDEAANRLIELSEIEINIQGRQTVDSSIMYFSKRSGGPYQPRKASNRLPINPGPRSFVCQFVTHEPRQTSTFATISVEVPKDAGPDDYIELFWSENDEFFDARLIEIIPNATAGLQMRISMWVRRIIAKMLDELANTSAEKPGE